MCDCTVPNILPCMALPLFFFWGGGMLLFWSCPCKLTWTLFLEGGKGYFRDSWSALFFSVKCEMAIFFLVNRDFHSSREAWFCKLFSVKREVNVLFSVNHDFHDVFVFHELWKDRFIFRETWSRPPLYHPLFAAWVSPGKKGEFMDWNLIQYHIGIIAILLEARQLWASRQRYYCK